MPSRVDGVHRRERRVGQRSSGGWVQVAQLLQVACLDEHVLGHRPIRSETGSGWERGAAAVHLAGVLATLDTGPATAAAPEQHHDHRVALCQAVDVGADRVDPAGSLVPDGAAEERPVGAGMQNVQVRMAQTGTCDLDPHLAGAGLRYLRLLQAECARTYEFYCAHSQFLPCCMRSSEQRADEPAVEDEAGAGAPGGLIGGEKS